MLEPDVLISIIAEEADCQKAKYPARSDAKDRDRDKAMAVVHSGPSQGPLWKREVKPTEMLGVWIYRASRSLPQEVR